MTKAAEKRPVGRPSSYDPAFCEQAVALGREGKSKAYIASQIGVHRETLDQWAKAHPEFADAIAHARDLAQAWWEDAGQKGMAEKQFNERVWSRSMAARFPADWRETSRHEHTGADGGPIRTFDLSGLTDEELEVLERLRGRVALAEPDQGGEGAAGG